MKKLKFFIIFISLFLILAPFNVLASEINSAGTYNIIGGTKSDYLIEYDNISDNSNGIIIANISGDYNYLTAFGSLGVINLGNYGVNSSNTVTVNGNIKFIRDDASENDFYGLEAYANSNLTLNGNFLTNQNGVFSDNNFIFGYGINSEAKSHIILNKNLTIDKINVSNTDGKVQSAGIFVSSKDGTTASSYEGTSSFEMPDSNSDAKISNISASSTSNKAIAVAITASGEANNTCSNSYADIKSNLFIDKVTAKGVNDEAYGVLGSVLGSINLSGNVSIKNISATTKEAYAVAATYGGSVNINNDNNKDVIIYGDIWALNCFDNSTDASVVNINLSSNLSSITGASITDDDSNDGIFGIINMSLTNNSVWHVINRTRSDGKNNISEVTNLNVNDSTINMFNDVYDSNQEVHVKNANNSNGILELNTDVLNITGSNKGDYVLIESDSGDSIISVNGYDKNASSLIGKTFKQWFATTPDKGFEFIPGSATIDGVTYYPIIEHDNEISGSGNTDWYIVGYIIDKQFILSFNSNGGSLVDSISGPSGTTIPLNQTPTKDGYIFEGWYLDSELTTLVNEITFADSNVVVYAKWTKKESPLNPFNPFTGDNIIPWILVMICTIVAIIYFIIIYNKNNKDEEQTRKEIIKTRKKKNKIKKAQ